jgi:2-haloacid dehalogenase
MFFVLDTNFRYYCRFRGAYCTEHEGEFLDIFGEMDVVADSLPDMAEKIIAATK